MVFGVLRDHVYASRDRVGHLNHDRACLLSPIQRNPRDTPLHAELEAKFLVRPQHHARPGRLHTRRPRDEHSENL